MKTKEHKAPTVTITLRVPEWLHDSVRVAAHDHRISMNEYCQQILAKSVDGSPIKGFNDAPKLERSRHHQTSRS